jgi:anaerobic C4-dicarboxylate transporter
MTMAARNGCQSYVCTGLPVRAKVASSNDLQPLRKAVGTGIAFIKAIITSPKSVSFPERNTIQMLKVEPSTQVSAGRAAFLQVIHQIRL